MTVPITGATLQNVTTEIFKDTAAGRSLSSCFAGATGTFDPAYQGSKNHLDDFRNYRASFADGQVLVGNPIASGPKRSLDYGTTWAEANHPQHNINGAVAVSGDGKYMLISDPAGQSAGGTIMISSDYGANFSAIPNATLGGIAGSICKFAVAISATGQYMTIGSYDANTPTNKYGIFRSTNYGVTWSSVYEYDVEGFNFCCMSATGQYQYLQRGNSSNSKKFWRSTNYGASWIESTYNCDLLCCSANGQYVYTTHYSGSDTLVNRSSNYGANIDMNCFYKSQSVYPEDWIASISCSGNGSRIALTSWWWLATSANYGSSWTARSLWTTGIEANWGSGYQQVSAYDYSGANLWCVDSDGGVRRSTNNGASFGANVAAGIQAIAANKFI